MSKDLPNKWGILHSAFLTSYYFTFQKLASKKTILNVNFDVLIKRVIVVQRSPIGGQTCRKGKSTDLISFGAWQISDWFYFISDCWELVFEWFSFLLFRNFTSPCVIFLTKQDPTLFWLQSTRKYIDSSVFNSFSALVISQYNFRIYALSGVRDSTRHLPRRNRKSYQS